MRSKLGGRPVEATIRRSPKKGGAYVTVLKVTLRQLGPSLMQPVSTSVLLSDPALLSTRRHMMFGDWPTDMDGNIATDPNPIQPGDQLVAEGVGGSPFPILDANCYQNHHVELTVQTSVKNA